MKKKNPGRFLKSGDPFDYGIKKEQGKELTLSMYWIEFEGKRLNLSIYEKESGKEEVLLFDGVEMEEQGIEAGQWLARLLIKNGVEKPSYRDLEQFCLKLKWPEDISKQFADLAEKAYFKPIEELLQHFPDFGGFVEMSEDGYISVMSLGNSE